MAALSIVLGVLSLACIALGVLTTPIPLLGALFSFGAPALAVAGIVVGGRAMSRARQVGPDRMLVGAPASGTVSASDRADRRDVPSHGVALTGVIVSTLALLPALLTAMTCGVCNALCSTGRIETRRDFQFDIQRGFPALTPDAGTVPAGRWAPRPQRGARPDEEPNPDGRPATPQKPGEAPQDEPPAKPGPDAPPPAFPPPPLRSL